MAIIHEDIVLELAQYLEIPTLLSLAQSFSAAFRASQEYSFWSPHELHPSVGLAAFLPDDHVGPWKSYSGDELRQAVTKMRSFNNRWESEPVVATHRVHLGRYSSLKVIPRSRWLYEFHHGTGGVSIVDGKTGMTTREDVDVGSAGVMYTEPIHVTCSLEPNRIHIGFSGMDDEEISNFALFEIILSVNEDAGKHYIGTQATQLRLWENIPEFPTIFVDPEFLVIESDQNGSLDRDLGIYHIPSSRHWKWRMSEKYKITLVDEWCVLTTGQRTEAIAIVVIHLPSLLSHPEATLRDLTLSRGATLTTGREEGGHRWIDVMPSRYLRLWRDGSSEYTLMLHNGHRRLAFNIQLEVVPGSLYGNVIWPGTRSALPDDETLKSQLDPQFATSGGNTAEPLRNGFPVSKWFTATQGDFDILVSTFDRNNYIKTLHITDLGNGGHSRMLDWEAPLKIQAGSDATAEMNYQGDPDQIRALPYWNSSIGMLLLRGPPLPGRLVEYQTCWF